MSAAHPVEFLLHACRTRGEKVALEAERDGHWYHYSWQALGEQVERLARGLLLCGCTEQEKIGILAPNMPEWTLADLAILAIRGVVVPLYPTNTLEQMRYVLDDAGVRLLFVAEASQLALAQTLWQQGVISRIIVLDEQVDLAGCPVAVHLGSLLTQADAEPQLSSQLDKRRAGYRLDDLLTLVYTSGTTGEPKGVMLDYANLQAVWQQHDERVSVGPEDVSLALLPLSHVYERFWSYYILYRGAKNVYLRDPQQLMSVLHLVRPTVMCAVPRVYERPITSSMARWPRRVYFPAPCLPGASRWRWPGWPSVRRASPLPSGCGRLMQWPTGWCLPRCASVLVVRPGYCRWAARALPTRSTASSMPPGCRWSMATA